MKITKGQLRQIIHEEITTSEEQIVTRGNYRGHTYEEAEVLKQLQALADLAWKINGMPKVDRHQRKNSSEKIQSSKHVVEQLAKLGIDSSTLSEYVQAFTDAKKVLKMAADEYYSYWPDLE